MNNKELTPEQIASMSEVIAKYMGKEHWYGFHTNWNDIHWVWEKVSKENIYPPNKADIINAISCNKKFEAFKALYNCITFINNLKQQNGSSI